MKVKRLANDSSYGNISHSGIKGMRWGVRRYQNPDGSLTPEGRAHYGRAAEASIRSEVKYERKEAYKNRRVMSDAELMKRIQRYNNEKRLKELTEEDLYPGRKEARDVMKNAAKITVSTALVGLGSIGVYYGVSKLTGNEPKLDPDDFAKRIAGMGKKK